jgi:hypothetical protein
MIHCRSMLATPPFGLHPRLTFGMIYMTTFFFQLPTHPCHHQFLIFGCRTLNNGINNYYPQLSHLMRFWLSHLLLWYTLSMKTSWDGLLPPMDNALPKLYTPTCQVSLNILSHTKVPWVFHKMPTLSFKRYGKWKSSPLFSKLLLGASSEEHLPQLNLQVDALLI